MELFVYDNEPNIIQIKKKDKSDQLLKKFNLNRIYQGVFTKDQIKEIREFIFKDKRDYYSLRTKDKSLGTFLYKLAPDEVLDRVKDFNIFSISESLVDADNYHLILQGEIQIFKDWTCVASLSDQRGISNREVQRNPKYRIIYNLIDDYEPSILGLKKIVDFYITYELFGFVIEFSMYDIPVGIKKENIIVWEIRDY